MNSKGWYTLYRIGLPFFVAGMRFGNNLSIRTSSAFMAAGPIPSTTKIEVLPSFSTIIAISTLVYSLFFFKIAEASNCALINLEYAKGSRTNVGEITFWPNVLFLSSITVVSWPNESTDIDCALLNPEVESKSKIIKERIKDARFIVIAFL